MKNIKNFVLKIKKHVDDIEKLVGFFNPAQYDFLDVYNEMAFLFGEGNYTFQLCDNDNVIEDYMVYIASETTPKLDDKITVLRMNKQGN